MADYINKDEYQKLMIHYKKTGELTRRMLELVQLHCKEVSRMFYFDVEEDREDAISSATHDFLKYGGGFRHSNTIQLKFERNLIDNEEFEFDVKGDKKYIFIAKISPSKKNEFKIGETENKTLDGLNEIINTICKNKLEASLHKVTKKINIMDLHNVESLGNKSSVKIKLIKKVALLKDEKIFEKEKSYVFDDPPNSFNHITSIIRNGIIKYLNTHHPKATRNGMKINFSQINKEQNGFFNY